MEEGLVKVVTPIDETPAAKAGIMANDIITHIDGEQVQGLTLNQAVEKMRGPVNSAVELRVRRGEGKEPIEISITRDIIRIRPVRSRVEGRHRLSARHAVQRTDLQQPRPPSKADDEIGEDKIKGFVLDLRNNPGGLLDQAIMVSDAFLDRGEIVSTRGRNTEESAALRREVGRSDEGQAHRRARQRRFGLGIRDRRRCAAGSPARDHPRHALLRQGLRPDDHPARRQRRASPDDGALLHAVGSVDPGQGHRARLRSSCRTSPRSFRAATKPRARRACAATWRTARKRRRAVRPPTSRRIRRTTSS